MGRNYSMSEFIPFKVILFNNQKTHKDVRFILLQKAAWQVLYCVNYMFGISLLFYTIFYYFRKSTIAEKRLFIYSIAGWPIHCENRSRIAI